MPQHVIVDGSNLATEGRAMPSLQQLNEAVMAFMAEHPDALITVVVDATFGHRISSSEVAEFDDAVSNNELVAPPAGAIGRGGGAVERLVPGVPRHVPVAVRRGKADRRQTRPAHRVGVRRPHSSARAD